MAPSLLAVGTAALACVGSAAAKQWYLRDTYDASNFFDKFDFVTDGEAGHAHYQSKKDAFDLGLAQYDGDEVYLGVDHKTLLEQGEGFAGRPSLRVESKAQYNHGLFIARFSHLPEQKCGAWPSFFTFGSPFPSAGGVDIYNGVDNAEINHPSLHTGNSKDLGSCRLDGEGQTSPVGTDNCDNTFSQDSIQLENQGCTASDFDGPFSTSHGGVYAVEWTTEFIKLYSWKWNAVPANIASEEPNTDSWGAPSVWLKSKNCEIDDHFVNQKLGFNINFCSSSWSQTCKESTGAETCVDFVSSKPGEFANAYFKIKDIRYFKGVKSVASTTFVAEPEATEEAQLELRDIFDRDYVGTTGTSSSFSTHGPFTNTSTTATGTSTSSTSLTDTTTTTTGTTDTTGSTTSTGTTDSTGSTTGTGSTTSTGTGSTTTTGTTGTGSSSTGSTDTTGSTTGTGTTGTGSTTTTGTGSSSTGGTAGPGSTSSTDTTGTGSTSGSSTGTGTESKTTGTGTKGPITTTTGTVDYHTSTIYTTITHTVTKCHDGEPCGYVTTKTIPWYTTVCPVTATPTRAPETITETITKVYTITKCPPEVKDCPYGKVVTKYITETYCPGGEQPTKPVDAPHEHPTKGDHDVVVTKTVTKGYVPPSAFTPGGCVGAECPPKTTVIYKTEGGAKPSGFETVPAPPTEATKTPECEGDDCAPVVTAGAAKFGASLAVVLGAIAAMMI